MTQFNITKRDKFSLILQRKRMRWETKRWGWEILWRCSPFLSGYCLLQKQKAPFIAPNASSFSRADHVKPTIIILIHLYLTGDKAEGRKSLWLIEGWARKRITTNVEEGWSRSFSQRECPSKGQRTLFMALKGVIQCISRLCWHAVLMLVFFIKAGFPD